MCLLDLPETASASAGPCCPPDGEQSWRGSAAPPAGAPGHRNKRAKSSHTEDEPKHVIRAEDAAALKGNITQKAPGCRRDTSADVS